MPIHRRRARAASFMATYLLLSRSKPGKPRRIDDEIPSMSYGPLARALLDSDEATVSQA